MGLSNFSLFENGDIFASLQSLAPLTGDTSWIDNPTGTQGLPSPVAPARPGGVLYGTDQNGNTIVLTPSTSTNLGTGQVIASAGNPQSSAPLTTSPKNNSTYLATIEKWFANLLTGNDTGSFDLEDIIFIVLGILLLAASVFSFKGTQTVIQTVGKKAAEVAA